MDVSIVIVNWNTKELLRNCLKSVEEQTGGIGYEIILVDNNSTDGSAEMVKREFENVILLENAENRGFAAANNQAVKIAKGRYILLLNSDTIVLDNAIEKTIIFADKHPCAAVTGCRVLNPDGTLQNTCFMFPSILNMLLSSTYLYKLFPKNRFFGREQMTWWKRNDVREVDVVTGCFMLVKHEAIEQAGLMDEQFFMYGEETDWCFRFKKNGWKIMFTPDGQIIHFGGQSTSQKKAEMMLQLRGSILLFIKKHKNILSHIVSRLLTALFFFLRIPYWLAVGLIRQGKCSESMKTAFIYALGGLYCLINWEKLLVDNITVRKEVSSSYC
jgi:GT2 family glycosyltransferase